MGKTKDSSRSSKSSKQLDANGHAYLDKRTTVRLAQSAGKKAASNAMVTMGHVITLKGGWVIKRYENGTEEKISRVAK